MSGTRRPPQARDRMLGMHLRLHRQEFGLSLETACKEVRMSLATLSRLENGKRHITTEDVAALLAVYRVDPAVRAELMAAARGGYRPAWWTDRTDGHAPEVLAVCSEGAHAVTEFALAAVPAALQTRRYGLGHLRASGAADLDTAWAAREAMQRSRVLIDQTYFLHEASLLARYGGIAALREQLHHLRAARDQGIGVRLVPKTALLGSGHHSWTMLEYTDATPVIYLDLHQGGLFLHHPAIAGYLADVDRLRKTAWTAEETRAYLHHLAGNL